MKTIQQLLENKDRAVWSVAPKESVYEAIALMAEKKIGSLMVLSDDKPVGIITERDYARKVILAGHTSRDTLVEEIMSTRVIFTSPEQTIEECMALMTDKHIRHLPVVDNGELIAMVSIGDLVEAIIHEQRFIIEQLEQYITS